MIHFADFHENHNHSTALREQNTEFHTNRSRKVENMSKY